MLAELLDAGTAAFQVSYESPSRFSLEYSRLFGAPSLRDIAIFSPTLFAGEQSFRLGGRTQTPIKRQHLQAGQLAEQSMCMS